MAVVAMVDGCEIIGAVTWDTFTVVNDSFTAENCVKSHLHYRKNRVRTNFFNSLPVGNNQVRLMIEKFSSTQARNHPKARQAHMKKMVRNEDAFTQRFRTAKGVRTFFFSVLGP